MTDTGWARKKVEGYGLLSEETAAAYIYDEHARSMRIVRDKLKAAQYAVEDSGSAVDLAYWDGQEAACKDILTALQRGRGKVKEIHIGAADNGWRLWFIEGTELYEEVFVVRRELIDRFAELAERLSQS